MISSSHQITSTLVDFPSSTMKKINSNKGGQKGTSVRVEGKKVFVGHSVFTDNHSDQQGAGVYTYNDACVYKSQFISNSAQRGSGIFVDTGGSLTLKDSDFQLNVALGSGGPAVYVNGKFICPGLGIQSQPQIHLAPYACNLTFSSADFQQIYSQQMEDNTSMVEETLQQTTRVVRIAKASWQRVSVSWSLPRQTKQRRGSCLRPRPRPRPRPRIQLKRLIAPRMSFSNLR